jgi:Bacterial extracellular solute-binding proteins, family 3
MKGLRRPGFLFVTAALAVSVLACTRANAPTPIQTLKPGVLQVCLYWGFAPFASAPTPTSPTSDWQGWDVDYLKAFATANGLGFEVVPKDFDGIWLQPGSKDDPSCDIAGTGISDTADRRQATSQDGQDGAWSNTYYHVLRAFLVRKDDNITQVEDLRGTKAIVTQGSTANIDLCYRMNQKGIHPCVKTDGDHPCSSFPGLSLSEFPETARETDPTCVYIDYPRDKDETCAGADVAAATNKYPGPFAYGGGYGSIKSLADGSSKGKCTVPSAPLAPNPAWPHCNMVDKGC